jgi:renal tumor antigen
MGSPPADLLAKLRNRSAHMSFDFPHQEGSGLAKLLGHVSPECQDLITRLLAYNPDERLSARQALKHPYFR